MMEFVVYFAGVLTGSLVTGVVGFRVLVWAGLRGFLSQWAWDLRERNGITTWEVGVHPPESTPLRIWGALITRSRVFGSAPDKARQDVRGAVENQTDLSL